MVGRWYRFAGVSSTTYSATPFISFSSGAIIISMKKKPTLDNKPVTRKDLVRVFGEEAVEVMDRTYVVSTSKPNPIEDPQDHG